MKVYYSILIAIILPVFIIAQSNSALEQWQSYLPYYGAENVKQSKDKLYFNTGSSLFSINKNDKDDVQFMSKIEGLTDSKIQFISYDNFNEQLIIVYQNSRIDILQDGNITTIVDLLKSTNIPGDKTIYSIHIADENYAYLGAGFGLLQLNLKNFNFGFTCETSLKINDIDQINEDLYISTDDGIYHYDNDLNTNPADFNQWTLFDSNVGLPDVYDSRVISVFQGKLYAQIDEDVWKLDESFSKVLDHASNTEEIITLFSSNSELVVGSRSGQFNSQIEFIQADDSVIQGNETCSNIMLDLLMDEEGGIWMCDEWDNIRYLADKNSSCEKINYNSARVLSHSDINILNNVVYLATGGADENYKPISNWLGYSVFENNHWENLYGDEFKDFSNKGFPNIFRIIKHPTKNIAYLGSYWNGIMKHDRDNNSNEVFNKDNSCLQGAVGDDDRTRVSGLAIDDSNNLWVSNFLAPEAISVFKEDGTCRSFNLSGKSRTTRIVIDNYGNKWIALFGGGIAILKTGVDVINDPYEVKILNTSNSALQSNVVNDITKDEDGTIWAGTDSGPVIFNCGDIFTSDCIGYRQKVIEDGDVAYLLETENIRCVEVDGANRKWFGTSNGIFVQSADGEEKIANYDEDNSAIFDNDIFDLAYNPTNGEMFISTGNGLQSYRTKTTKGNTTTHSDVYAFPNPVRPEYNGDIAITGLPREADVKITDVTGKLVYETTAMGGLATWNGNQLNGERAATGVYLVFSSSTKDVENIDSYVTKIFMVK